MEKLERAKLWSLEEYAERRPDFRAEVIAHKKHRRVAISPHATLYFEDLKTMRYQVQEMLRTERIFEAEGIEEELSAYNPLIPDGTNLKATFMIEYADVTERQAALATLAGVEETLWLQARGAPKIQGIANEDLPRSTDEKTAAVHFLRFELDPVTIAALKQGEPVEMGISHPALSASVSLSAEQQASLAADLD